LFGLAINIISEKNSDFIAFVTLTKEWRLEIVDSVAKNTAIGTWNFIIVHTCTSASIFFGK
jgi:hypothetical protein